jgi:hypothetical protein
MVMLKTAEEIQRVATLPATMLQTLFTSLEEEMAAHVRTVLQAIRDGGNDADAIVAEESGKTKWIVNVKTAGGDTPPERHRDWHDYSLYLLGGNDIAVGGTMTDAEEVSDGEWRKGSLASANTITVRPGDFLWIPAGAPHENHFLPGTGFVIVKVRIGNETLPFLERVREKSSPQHLSRAVMLRSL